MEHKKSATVPGVGGPVLPPWEGRRTTWCRPTCGCFIGGDPPFCERVNYLIK
jgi:hypothetical protein